jgi:tRNA G18 (ribose-2'-O)-methylase SpoU
MSNQLKKFNNHQLQVSKPSIEEVLKKERMPLFVVLDNIRSTHNVGAIFRSCDAIVASKIFLCGITAHPPRADIAKAALGADQTVPWEYVPTTQETLLKLKENGVTICGLELAEGSQHYKEARYDFPMALVLGNEVEGVSDECMELLDMCVQIPMLGRANSLNVATAFGIVGYEILWQYGQR